VGCALEAADGRIFVGCNVENASYGLTMCAERVALGAAVAAGAREFRRAVIVTDGPDPATPCGACRQALAEFAPALAVVGIGGTNERAWRLDELLPFRFEIEHRSASPPTADGA
jgi:homotetrameric cytidine deaminase